MLNLFTTFVEKKTPTQGMAEKLPVSVIPIFFL
jgi:hypothetical protein